MRAPDFWWQSAPSLAASLLSPLGWIWGEVSARRMQREGQDAGAPVLCIGNFTAGGAGKTPTAIACAKILSRQGYKPAFLTRGYGGSFSRDGAAYRVDLQRTSAAEAGDEPLLLARDFPTFVASDRIKGANAATAMGADMLIMDDGLQNPGLKKDVALAVADGVTGIGNGMCIPAGPMRAPLVAQLPRIDGMIQIGNGEAGDALARRLKSHGKPVFGARLVPDPAVAAQIGGRKAVAFAGIGRPGKFFATLEEIGVEIAEAFAFDDHHMLDADDIALLQKTARQHDAVLVTTEKDLVRIAASFSPGAQPLALPVTLQFNDAAGFAKFLIDELQRAHMLGRT